MNTPSQLNTTSPIVQRVLQLRARRDALRTVSHNGEQYFAADVASSDNAYQWQMWQKSDLSAYSGQETVHRCNM